MRILVVEDYRPLRESLARGLREAGFAVDATGDGEEGFWFADSSDYDVIVLDIMLPSMDGLSILERLRGKQNPTHILLLTAKDTLADRVTGLERGADDYLVKPFAFAELLARIQALVRRKYGTKSPIISVGNLVMDTQARSVRRGRRTLELTRREYRLLEYLALRRNQVVTREEIWEHLYDCNAEPGSNVIDVYIGVLRKKLESGGMARLIHTRRGLGYILTESP